MPLPVFVPELVCGYRFTDESNEEIVRDTQALLEEACQSLQHAGLALYLYTESQLRDSEHDRASSSEEWLAQMEEKRQAADAIRSEVHAQVTSEFVAAMRPVWGGLVDINLEAGHYRWEIDRQVDDRIEIELERRKWRAGELPRSWSHHIAFFHAKSFLFALDTVGSCIYRLAKLATKPEQFDVLSRSFNEAFPDLRGVRNSAHHDDQRATRSHSKGKIDVKAPPEWAGGPGGGSVFIRSSLVFDNYGETMENGEYGQIAVTVESLITARDILQDILNLYPWDASMVRRYP